jgi:hypothetical protein
MSAKRQTDPSPDGASGRDDYQRAIERSADRFVETHDDTNLFIVHLMFGSNVSEPGAIRKSAIRAGNSYLSRLGEKWRDEQLAKGHANPNVNQHHSEVLRQHIRYLDRKNTFLNLMEAVFTKYSEAGVEQLTCNLSQVKSTDYWIEVKPDQSPKKGARRSLEINFRYSDSLANTLIPTALAEEYFRTLYLDDESIANRRDEEDEADAHGWRTGFILGRAEVFGKTPEAIQATAVSSLYPNQTESKPRNDFWKLLGELQSALLYFRGARDIETTSEDAPQLDDSPVGTVIIERRTGASLMVPTIVTVLSPNPANAEEIALNNHDAVFTIFERTAERKSDIDKICSCISPTFETTAEGSLDPKSIFIERVPQIFTLKSQANQLQAISLWMVWLTEYLHKSVHEGHSLNFWLVAGDQTEFRDKTNIDFQRLEYEDVEGLSIPIIEQTDNSGTPHLVVAEPNLEDYVKRAAKSLEKEHFPWFQRGRYALFWDVGQQERFAPTGLVGIKGSNWEQILTEVYKPDPDLQIPVCCIAYTTGAPKEAGFVIHRLKSKTTQTEDIGILQNNPFATIIRHRKGKWHLSVDARKNRLIDSLKKYISTGESTKGTTLDEIVDISLAVADNPRVGGIIVIVKENQETLKDPAVYFQKLFARMGRAWPIDGTREDRLALISHDGATLVALNNRTWGYRFLLAPDSKSGDVRDALVMCAQTSKNNFPLTGVGSRRWSAALAAFNENVGAVIVISQDGDIQFWASRDGGLADSACLFLPQVGTENWIDLATECRGD